MRNILNIKRTTESFRRILLDESIGNSYDPEEFIDAKTGVGNKSNMKQDTTPASVDVDNELSQFDQDAVQTGIDFENSLGIKKDVVRAKEKVLANLKRNPEHYNNPETIMGGDEEIDLDIEDNEYEKELVPPSKHLGSADQPSQEDFVNDGFDPTSVGPRPEATEGQPPNEDFYAITNAQMRVMESTDNITKTSISLLQKSLTERYHSVEVRPNSFDIKNDKIFVRIVPLSGFSDFAVGAKNRKTNERILNEIVDRKQLFRALDIIFNPVKTLNTLQKRANVKA